jgi:hypothetical protein
VLEFLDLMKEAFGCRALFDSHNRPVDLTEAGLRRVFEKAAKRLLPGLGASQDIFTIPPDNRDKNTVRIEIHTGASPTKIFIDSYDISMDVKRKVPDFDYLERSIEIFKPFEAFLAEDANETRLDAFNRQQAIPKFDKPAIIRGFHYLDKDMARSIGGIKYCLKAPAWQVKRFREGVLIELVPGRFDSSNPEHLEIQEDVMIYFNLL